MIELQILQKDYLTQFNRGLVTMKKYEGHSLHEPLVWLKL